MITLCTFVFSLLYLTAGQNDVIFASVQAHHQDLATRISCQVEEAQHFQYSSVTELWGSNGGEIILIADVVLHCLGDDEGGPYGNEALKYRVDISNLQMTEEKDSDFEVGNRKKRKKRSAKDFFTNSWKKVKRFFNRIFGRKTEQPDTTRASNGDADVVKDIDQETSGSDAEEVFNIGYDMYSAPFQFIQLANGTIPEIRFSENEIEDARVRNFKRHLVDAFSTQLDFDRTKRAIVETSVMGEHTSNYNITVTGQTANLNSAGWVSTTQPQENEPKVVVVKKVVTEKDIVQLSPNKAINDKNRMDLETQQMQVFRDGRMISSSGTTFLSLAADGMSEKSRFKRETEDDATSYIQTHTSFDLELRRRRRRSAEEFARHQEEKNTSFRPFARIAEVDDNHEKRKLQELQESSDFEVILEHLIKGQEISRDDEIQSLFEIVEREVNLKVDNRPNSMSSIIRRTFTMEKMESLCSKNVSSCKDYLQLVALAGGTTAEKIFLEFLRNVSESSTSQIQLIADIMSDIPQPSSFFLSKLADMLDRKSLRPEVMGSLIMSISHLASEREDMKKRISDVISRMLLERQKACLNDVSIIDLLEAVGNLKCDRIVPRVLQVSAECRDSSTIQIACAHALRHFSDLNSVQQWIESVAKDGDCDVIKEVVGSLMDKIQDQELTPGVTMWPRFGFNKIDTILQSYLTNHRCSMEDILLYFKRKRNSEANSIALNHFGFESEAWEPQNSGTRQKRRGALWDDLNCQEWTEDSKYTPIQDKEEFASDRATYNKRKSCLAFRKLGVKGANAEIYAGMFAGVKEPSDPPKYKLFTKFVSGVNFLGHQVEIGSFYFYLHNGRTKAYVRIMGRTRQEFTNEGCTPTELRYRPLKHIPLYLLNVANVELSLGVHLSSRLSVDTECPENDVYQLQPSTNVRIGGEALGTVMFIRGSANLGADLNYKLQFIFTPTPDMCLKGNHGFEPMSINFESYFQLWNSAKQDWGKTRMWKPSFLSWNLSKGRMKQWFGDTCVATQRTDAVPKGLERELE